MKIRNFDFLSICRDILKIDAKITFNIGYPRWLTDTINNKIIQ